VTLISWRSLGLKKNNLEYSFILKSQIKAEKRGANIISIMQSQNQEGFEQGAEWIMNPDNIKNYILESSLI
jgi:hypothetical protein